MTCLYNKLFSIKKVTYANRKTNSESAEEPRRESFGIVIYVCQLAEQLRDWSISGCGDD